MQKPWMLLPQQLTWQVYAMLLMSFTILICALSQDTQILDSRASEHMSSKQDILHDLSALANPIIYGKLT